MNTEYPTSKKRIHRPQTLKAATENVINEWVCDPHITLFSRKSPWKLTITNGDGSDVISA